VRFPRPFDQEVFVEELPFAGGKRFPAGNARQGRVSVRWRPQCVSGGIFAPQEGQRNSADLFMEPIITHPLDCVK
jgi:hypothetical protein